ncbi:hypothetical protein B0A49_00284 [Cryomyces minteri]|uniref:ABM domain-containing protein n=1 Tax=Cryomyces minteri TaxID=331657 RepID=A0A4U0XXP2_9PEZI|nr:hypothetical protein B0A49_00284 [Cryomyces minteri]
MSNLEVVAIISPAPGKADRVEELLLQLAKHVHESEPETYKYHLHKEIDKKEPEFVMIESYKNKESLKSHQGSDAFKSLVKQITEESLLAKPLAIYMLKAAGGFEKRSKI